jgi:UPF0271 protein
MVGSQETIIIVDTSALMGQSQFAAYDVLFATTPIILKEMIQRGLKGLVTLLEETDKLRVLMPSQDSQEKVFATAKELGDLSVLSNADKQLLALALDFTQQAYHVILLSDDYSMQNVAKRLGIDFRPSNQVGIREIITWETYCSACKGTFSDFKKGEPCPVCGTVLTRRATKKHQIN